MALGTLAEIASAGRSEIARIAAAKEILIRAWDNCPPELDDATLEAAAKKILARRVEAKQLEAPRPSLVIDASTLAKVAK